MAFSDLGCPWEGSYQCQSAVPAHAMSEDADPLTVHLLEVLEDGLG